MKVPTQHPLLLVTTVLLVVPGLYAQRTSSISARFAGDRNSSQGKCTFEVDVDGVAEVSVQGSRGTLRTLAGEPARWVRLDCNRPLPPNPRNFRFQGIDGRGRQTLIRNPSRNRGVAVVRLEDPKGGREGYTGDLIWDEGEYGNGGGGDSRDPREVCQREASRRYRIDARNIRTQIRERRRDQYLVDFQFRNNFGTTNGSCVVASSGALLSFRTN
ncbi:MAG TPA: hypothetical protein VF023_01465 [Bryobacteraceae bacterium]|jgi:hypothetical protein